MKHQFVDAQQMAKEHPDTFEAPTKSNLNAIGQGSMVKVSICKERFWVIVNSRKGYSIVGTVDNELINTNGHGYCLGDRIEFEIKNVFVVHMETA